MFIRKERALAILRLKSRLKKGEGRAWIEKDETSEQKRNRYTEGMTQQSGGTLTNGK